MKKKNNFQRQSRQILERESSSSQLFKDIYWIHRTEDSSIILSYLERNHEKILKEQHKSYERQQKMQLNHIRISLKYNRLIQAIPKLVK
ncbi:unnamed protein product [Paramecium octaurelia]|uniref:Uncharacterized protein n=1 Tax=Paramecium octaurelia TaxID=43137 RepID=A0A8S1YPG9_PAROT|nr:unnamed protein product [Paramecium octaurelia]